MYESKRVLENHSFPKDVYIVSVVIVSLFTNVPIDETISNNQ